MSPPPTLAGLVYYIILLYITDFSSQIALEAVLTGHFRKHVPAHILACVSPTYSLQPPQPIFTEPSPPLIIGYTSVQLKLQLHKRI